MSLIMRGKVLSVRATKGGAWQRVILPGRGRVNDLLMMPASAFVKEGEEIEVEVSAQVESTSEGRPTRNIVFWPEGIERAAK